MPFNVEAKILLLGPTAAQVNAATASIRSAVQNITANVGVNVNPRSTQQLKGLTTQTVLANNAVNKATAVSSVYGAASTRVASSIRHTSKATAELTSTMEKFGYSSGLAIKRFLAFTVVATPVLATFGALAGGIRKAIEFERELVKVAQVGRRPISTLGFLNDEIDRLAVKFGASSAELVNVSQILAQSGQNANQVKIALEAISKVSLTPTFSNFADVTEAAIAVMSQFDKQASDLIGVFGSLDRVAADFAVEFPDLIDVIKRAGGAFHSVGGSLEEMIALFTAVRSTTRESAESIATGFRTIFTRLQRSSTINLLREMNIELRDANGLFIGPYQAIEKLNKALRETDSRSEIYGKIIEELGGFRQVSKVIPLIQQFDKAQRALQSAKLGKELGLEGYEEVLKTLSVQLAQTREKFLVLIRDVTQTETFKALTTIILDLANAFISLADAIKPAIPFLTALGAIKIARLVLPVGRNVAGGFRATSHKAQGGPVGYARGGSVHVKLTPGEGVITNPATVRKVGLAALDKLNRVDKTGIAVVPGVGDVDTYDTFLPKGSYVIRKKAMEKVFGTKKMAQGRVVTINLPVPIALPGVAEQQTQYTRRYRDVGGTKLGTLAERLSGLPLTTKPRGFFGVGLRTTEAVPNVALREFAKVGLTPEQAEIASRKFNRSVQVGSLDDQQLNNVMRKRIEVIGMHTRSVQGLARSETLVDRAMKRFDRVIMQGGNTAEAYVASQRVLNQQIRNQSRRGMFANGLGSVGRFGGAAAKKVGANIGKYGFGALLALEMSGVLNESDIPDDILKERAGIDKRQSYARKEGLKGATRLSLTGAFIGAAFGPWGIAIGAATGALVGFTNSLNEANKKISEQKLTSSLDELSQSFERFSKGLVGEEDVQEKLEQARQKQSGVIQARREESRQFFNVSNIGTSVGYGLKALFTSATMEGLVKQQLVDRAVQFNQMNKDFYEGISPQSGGLIERDFIAGMSEADIRKKYSRELLDLAYARISPEEATRARQIGYEKENIEEVVKEIFKDLQTQKDIKDFADKPIKAFIALETQASNLAKAFSLTRDSVKNFQSSMDLVSGIFSGQVGFKASTVREDIIANRTLQPERFERLVRGTGTRLGISKDVQAAVIEGNIVKSILPGVLEEIAGSIEKYGPEVTLEEAIQKSFGGRVSSDMINLLVTQLSSQLGGPQQSMGGLRTLDVEGRKQLADKVIARQEGLAKLFEDFTKQEGEVYQEYIDNLSQASQLQRQITEVQQKLYNIELTRVRTGAQRRFEDFQSATAVDIPGVQRAFQAQQSLITGVGGPQSTDAKFLADRLRSLTAELQRANEERLILEANPNVGGKQLNEAADKIRNLQDAIEKTRQGLLNLTNSTDVLSDVQQRLSELQRAEEGRFGLFERFFSGGPRERFEIKREIMAALKVTQRGTLQGLTIPEQNLAVRGLNSLRDIPFFGKNNITGEMILRQLFKQSGFADLGGGREAKVEERGLHTLKDQLIENQGKAVTGLAKVLQDEHNRFLTTLATSQDTFFTRLAEYIKQINARGMATGGLVNGPSGVDKVHRRLTKGEYVVRKSVVDKNRELLDGINYGKPIKMQFGGVMPRQLIGNKRIEEFNRKKGDFGGKFYDIQRDNYNAIMNERDRLLVGRKRPVGDDGGALPVGARLTLLGRTNDLADRKRRLGRLPNEQDRRMEVFYRRSGISPTSLNQRLGNEPDKNGGVGFLEWFAALARGPGFATGSNVFGKSGIDKIPAMLTKGEFVVKEKQAAKYRNLLELINSGKLPKMQAGGSVGPVMSGQLSLDTSSFSEASKRFGATLNSFIGAMDRQVSAWQEIVTNIPHNVVHDVNIGEHNVNLVGSKGIVQEIANQVISYLKDRGKETSLRGGDLSPKVNKIQG